MPYALPSSVVVDALKTSGMGLNLRDAPAGTGRWLGTMPDGTRLGVVGVARQGYDPNASTLWYQVRFMQATGYCAADFLAVDPDPIVPLPLSASVDAQKTGGAGLNLRDAPSRTGRFLATMSDNAPLQVVGAAREDFSSSGALWYQVLFGAQRGYCLGDFVATTAMPGGQPLVAQAGARFVGVWPVVGPARLVTALFNEPRPDFASPIKAHEGIDLRAPDGSPIVAWADGRVAMTWQWDGFSLTGNHAYGNHVKLFHPSLGLFTMYCHLQSFGVAKDQVVRMGDPLGLADNTGNSKGSHLHFNLIDPVNGLNGYVYPKVVDPAPYLPQPYTIL